MVNEQLEFKVTSEWEKFAKENSWAAFIPEFAVNGEGHRYMKKRGSSVIYKENKDNSYVCVSCNSEIKEAKVAHSIWNGPFALSGSGKVYSESVPYCEKCEEKPDFHGSPI